MRGLERLYAFIRGGLKDCGYTCDYCGAELFSYPKPRVCERCQEKLQRLDGPRCPKCDRKTVSDGVCSDCKRKAPSFYGAACAFVYEGIGASFINKCKNGNRKAAHFLGGALAERIVVRFPELLEAKDGEPLLILPVPCSEERAKQRGFNQAEDLALVVQSALEKAGIACQVETDALLRLKVDNEQKHLSIKGREDTAQKGYHLHKRKLCKDRAVLIVDDIMTTGATLDACCGLIERAGASRVYAAAVCALAEKRE